MRNDIERLKDIQTAIAKIEKYGSSGFRVIRRIYGRLHPLL
jgi:hypothetical protein